MIWLRLLVPEIQVSLVPKIQSITGECDFKIELFYFLIRECCLNDLFQQYFSSIMFNFSIMNKALIISDSTVDLAAPSGSRNPSIACSKNPSITGECDFKIELFCFLIRECCLDDLVQQYFSA